MHFTDDYCSSKFVSEKYPLKGNLSEPNEQGITRMSLVIKLILSPPVWRDLLSKARTLSTEAVE
jgi:hypothetical protein